MILAYLLVVPVLLLILLRQRRPGYVRLRTPEHEALLAFLREIATVPDIVEAIEDRGGVRGTVQAQLLESVGEWEERKLRGYLGVLMGDRIVRRQVAKHLEKQGGDRRKVMNELLKLTEA